MKKSTKLILWVLLLMVDVYFSCIQPVLKVDETDVEELKSQLRGSIVFSYILYVALFFITKKYFRLRKLVRK